MERSSKTANAELPNRQVEPTQKEGGEYKIIMKMASGSFGTVFKVQRNSDNRVFVMKRIPLVLDDKHNRSVRLRQTLNERHKHENDVLFHQDEDETRGNGKLHKLNANLKNLNVDNNHSNKNNRGILNNNNIPQVEKDDDSFYDNIANNNNEDLYEQDDEEELRRREVLHEATLMKELHHPFIVRQMDCFTFNETDLCLILDYYGGGDLHSMINQAKENKTFFPLNTVMLWFVQVLLALHYLHVKGIVHRDMKTHNVFLNDTKQFVAIGDFGIAESVEEIVNETVMAQQASCADSSINNSNNSKNQNNESKISSNNSKTSRSSSAKRSGGNDTKRPNSNTSQNVNGKMKNNSDTNDNSNSNIASSPVFNKNKLSRVNSNNNNNTNSVKGGKRDTTVMHALRRNLQREREKNISSNVQFTPKNNNNNNNVDNKSGSGSGNMKKNELAVVGSRHGGMHVNGMRSRSSVVINTNNSNGSFNSNNKNIKDENNTKRSSSTMKRDKATETGLGRASSPKLPSLGKDRKRSGSAFSPESNNNGITTTTTSNNTNNEDNSNNYNSTERRRKKSLMGSTTYALKGTPLYMAPELLQGGLGSNTINNNNSDNSADDSKTKPTKAAKHTHNDNSLKNDNQVMTEITKSGDMWSLGCVLYELLTLHHPFESRELGALVLKIVQGNYKPLHECMSEFYKQHGGAKPIRYPDWVHKLVSSLLTIDPLQRPSCEELLTRWPPIVHYFNLLLKEIGEEEKSATHSSNTSSGTSNYANKRQGNMSYKNGKSKEASSSLSSSSSCTSPFWLFVESSSKKTFKYQVSHLTELQKRNELEKSSSEVEETNSSSHNNKKMKEKLSINSNNENLNESAESQKNVHDDDYNYFAKPLPSSNLIHVNSDIDNNVNLYSFFDSKHDQSDFLDGTVDNSDNVDEIVDNMDRNNEDDAKSKKVKNSRIETSTNKGKRQVNTRVRKKNNDLSANNEASKNTTSASASSPAAKRGSKRENSLEVCDEEIDTTLISWKDASNSYGSSPGTFFDENQAAEFIYKERSFSLPSCDNDEDDDAESEYEDQHNIEGTLPSTSNVKRNKEKPHASRSNSLVHLNKATERGMKPSASMKPYMIYDEPDDKLVNKNNSNKEKESSAASKVKNVRKNSQVNNTPTNKAISRNKSKAPLVNKSVLTQENVRNLIKEGNNNNNMNSNKLDTQGDHAKGHKATKHTENDRNVSNNNSFLHDNDNKYQNNNKRHAAATSSSSLSFALPHDPSVHLDMASDVHDMTTPQLVQEVTHMRALIQHILREQQRVYAMEAISPRKNNPETKLNSKNNKNNKKDKSPYEDKNSVTSKNELQKNINEHKQGIKASEKNRRRRESSISSVNSSSKTSNTNSINRSGSIRSDANKNNNNNNKNKVENKRNISAIKQQDKRGQDNSNQSNDATSVSYPSRETSINNSSAIKSSAGNRNANRSGKRAEKTTMRNNSVQEQLDESKIESEANKSKLANGKQIKQLPDVNVNRTKNINNNKNNDNNINNKNNNVKNNIMETKNFDKVTNDANQANLQKQVMRSLELEPEWYWEEEEEEELEESDKEKQPRLRPISEKMQARREVLLNIIEKYFNESTLNAVYDYYKSTRASKLMERDPIKVLSWVPERSHWVFLPLINDLVEIDSTYTRDDKNNDIAM